MKRFSAMALCLVLLIGLFSGCGTARQTNSSGKTVKFTDSVGRTVEVPAKITRVAASGSIAQMMLLTLAPELLVGLSDDLSTAQLPYLPECIRTLPVFGQFYGSRANLNLEALMEADPQIIIDLGNAKSSIKEDMDTVQSQTGIPTVFIEEELHSLPDAYRALGCLLGREEKAEQLALYIEQALALAEENAAKIPEDERKTVLFGTGSDGLACNAKGSMQADVIELIGAINVVEPLEATNRNGGTVIDPEQAYAYDPDVLLLTADGPYETITASTLAELRAVKDGSYYEIPELPYNWMCSPPSVNRVLGIRWLGNLLYPEVYDYDMVSEAQTFFRLFWEYELSEEKAAKMLARSTFK
ncbi:MAG: ABC transporter substrate-binding protein [Clostridia bacterium]|nr:ABC transporter substrate-binding protein [Clostridia bacterium]